MNYMKLAYQQDAGGTYKGYATDGTLLFNTATGSSTEDNKDNVYSVSSAETQINVTDLTRNEDAYIYDDKGVNYYSADFDMALDVKITAMATNALGYVWVLTNVVDDIKGIADGAGNGDALILRVYNSAGTYQWIFERIRGGGGNSHHCVS